MLLFVPRETSSAERRVALTPESAGKLVGLGFDVVVETGLGDSLSLPDEDFKRHGAEVARREEALPMAGVVLRLRPPETAEVRQLKAGCVHVSFLEPFSRLELVRTLAGARVSALCMELVPRTTLAQKMDALSSQANLAGYAAVILAAQRLDKVLPMMSTPAGTIPPARVFVVGAGVAGLQAIATARRLGARVEAFDTRPAAQEQIASLGARAVKIDLGETGEAKGGYARELSEEQLFRQRQAMARSCAAADIVITTAQVFGKPPPRLITRDMIQGMRPGSVIVDLAAGNVEGVKVDEETLVSGVRLIGFTNLASRVAQDASRMYASNVTSLIEHLWRKDAASFNLDAEDEITTSVLLTHNGRIRHKEVRELVAQQ